MNIFCIADSVEDEFWGPYTDENLADKVLKIVKMAVDEGSEMRIVESDLYADQLRAGLLPFKICVELLGNQVRNTEVKLAWPPAATEGIVLQREGYMEYFVWAASEGEAKVKLASLPRRRGRTASCEENEEMLQNE
jgi:hypothetical protein